MRVLKTIMTTNDNVDDIDWCEREKGPSVKWAPYYKNLI